MSATATIPIALLLAGVTWAGSGAALQEPPGPPGRQLPAVAERSAEEVIQAQLRAFNEADVDALVANVAEEFVYYAVDPDYTEPQLRGRVAFRRSMQAYFASTPGARAEIEEIFAVGPYVAARERAYWLSNGIEVSQASIAVYEVHGGLIHRVWYYPAVP